MYDLLHFIELYTASFINVICKFMLNTKWIIVYICHNRENRIIEFNNY